MRGLHIQVFEIDARTASECRKVMEEQRIANSDAVELGDDDMRIGRVAKQRFIERVLGCDHFVGEFFVVGEFFDKA